MQPMKTEVISNNFYTEFNETSENKRKNVNTILNNTPTFQSHNKEASTVTIILLYYSQNVLYTFIYADV